MRAYNLAMLLICITAGVALMFASNLIDISGNDAFANSWDNILVIMSPYVLVGLASGLGVSSLAKNYIDTATAASISVFSTIYLTAGFTAFGLFNMIGESMIAGADAFNFFRGVFFFVMMLVFLVGFVQIAQGGQKGHV